MSNINTIKTLCNLAFATVIATVTVAMSVNTAQAYDKHVIFRCQTEKGKQILVEVVDGDYTFTYGKWNAPSPEMTLYAPWGEVVSGDYITIDFIDGRRTYSVYPYKSSADGRTFTPAGLKILQGNKRVGGDVCAPDESNIDNIEDIYVSP